MGDAAIAHVVHVQAVARYDVLYLVLAARYPVPHHREPPEHSYLHFVGHRTDGIHDEQVDGPLEHARGELRIHQHDVEPGRLETAYSLADRAVIFLDVPTPQRLVAACLPDDELRVVRQHVALEARQHLEGHLAADAVIKLPGELAALLIVSDPQIQQAALGPMAHDAVAAEHWHVVGVR